MFIIVFNSHKRQENTGSHGLRGLSVLPVAQASECALWDHVIAVKNEGVTSSVRANEGCAHAKYVQIISSHQDGAAYDCDWYQHSAASAVAVADMVLRWAAENVNSSCMNFDLQSNLKTLAKGLLCNATVSCGLGSKETMACHTAEGTPTRRVSCTRMGAR
jgi:hypothetical protein